MCFWMLLNRLRELHSCSWTHVGGFLQASPRTRNSSSKSIVVWFEINAFIYESGFKWLVGKCQELSWDNSYTAFVCLFVWSRACLLLDWLVDVETKMSLGHDGQHMTFVGSIRVLRHSTNYHALAPVNQIAATPVVMNPYGILEVPRIPLNFWNSPNVEHASQPMQNGECFCSDLRFAWLGISVAISRHARGMIRLISSRQCELYFSIY